MSTDKKSSGNYLVGYRKPPRQTRFKKGRSGNPTGRPKGTPNFGTALERALSEQVVVTEGGKRYAISKLEAAVKQLVNKATVGEHRAMQQLMRVLSVIDSEPSEPSTPSLITTESDTLVMNSIAERIRNTKHEEGHDVAHT